MRIDSFSDVFKAKKKKSEKQELNEFWMFWMLIYETAANRKKSQGGKENAIFSIICVMIMTNTNYWFIDYFIFMWWLLNLWHCALSIRIIKLVFMQQCMHSKMNRICSKIRNFVISDTLMWSFLANFQLIACRSLPFCWRKRITQHTHTNLIFVLNIKFSTCACMIW